MCKNTLIAENENHSGSVKVAEFDGNLLSDDKQLKLNVDERTNIVNTKGEAVAAAEIKEYSAIVFYGATTKSIPPQTSPDRIVVFPKLEEAPVISPEIAALIGNDYKEADGKLMVPLRIVAEGLGYKVESTGNGAIISKGALAFTVTRGEKAYGHNRALHYFEAAPVLLEENKTYVEYEFALQLL